jgi:tRNA nucleotidyltransferase (CCA-adding enzyme)
MQVYLVGGAVRDTLLTRWHGGQPAAHDRDWLVVGTSPQAMVDAGFAPVGRDFPVFLHPQSHEEFALARTERKVAAGYRGFTFHAAPNVTLAQDLARRDLTINTLAVPLPGAYGLHPPADWVWQENEVVDLHGGLQDLRQGVLRHVTEAFGEDPVRLLRLARFAARWPQFTVATATADWLQAMVQRGEVQALVAERVWAELAGALQAQAPERALQVLHACGALAQWLPGVLPTSVGLERAVQRGHALAVRWACLCQPLNAEALQRVQQSLRVPRPCADLATLLHAQGSALAAWPTLTPEALASHVQACDPWRRPQRFAQLLQAVACSHHATEADVQALTQAAQVMANVPAEALAKAGGNVAQRIAQARLEALRRWRHT